MSCTVKNTEEKDAAFLKLYDGHDWKWFCCAAETYGYGIFKKTLVRAKKLRPQRWRKRHHKYFLRFTYTEEVTFKPKHLSKNRRSAAWISASIRMQSVPSCVQTELSWEERFIRLIPVTKTGCTVRWDGSEDFRGNMDLRQAQGRWAYAKRLNTELGKKIAGEIVMICGRKPGRCDCVSNIWRCKGKLSGKEKAETADVEKTGYPETLWTAGTQERESGFPGSVPGTRAGLPYDGSGEIARDTRENHQSVYVSRQENDIIVICQHPIISERDILSVKF